MYPVQSDPLNLPGEFMCSPIGSRYKLVEFVLIGFEQALKDNGGAG